MMTTSSNRVAPTPAAKEEEAPSIEDLMPCCFCITAVLGVIYILCAFLTTCIGLAYAHNDCSMVYFNWCLSVFILRACLYSTGVACKKEEVICMQATIGIIFLAFSFTTMALSAQAMHNSGCDMSRDGSGPLLVVGSVMYALVDLGLGLFFILSPLVVCD